MGQILFDCIFLANDLGEANKAEWRCNPCDNIWMTLVLFLNLIYQTLNTFNEFCSLINKYFHCLNLLPILCLSYFCHYFCNLLWFFQKYIMAALKIFNEFYCHRIRFRILGNFLDLFGKVILAWVLFVIFLLPDRRYYFWSLFETLKLFDDFFDFW